jgi:hypothetical protein
VQSTFVLRDADGGFGRGFYDSSRGVQWRNELKFDLYLRPSGNVGLGEFKVEKVFLSYRGAYDAIFELTDRYDLVGEKEKDDFEIGKDDVEWENDLREAFIDIIADAENTTTTLRIGRQIVQWGENDIKNMINVINPTDLSYQMFFSPPEDTAMPLWMLRLNHDIRDVGPFRTIGLEFVAVPDIRPSNFAPLHGEQRNNFGDPIWNTDAPYAFLFDDFDTFSDQVVSGVNQQVFGPGSPTGITLASDANTGTTAMALTYEEDEASSTWENMEYGFRLYSEIFDVNTSFYYLVHFQDDPAVDVTDSVAFGARYIGWVLAGQTPGAEPAGPNAVFTHPRLRSYGLSFNTYIPSLDIILRGEAALHDKKWLTDTEGLLTGQSPGYSAHKVYQYMLGIDKDFKQWYWTGTIANWSMSFQAFYQHIDDWKDNSEYRIQNKEDSWLLTYMVRTDYHHGQILPGLTANYDTKGVWNIRPDLMYKPNHKWFFNLTLMTFLGNRNSAYQFPTVMVENGSEVSFRMGYNF